MKNIKDWWIFRKRDKDDVTYALGIAVGAVTTTVGALVMYKLGGEAALTAAQRGLDKVEGMGYVKFFDPETGMELTQKAACALLRKKNVF